ncbi:DUF4286 family protein [Parabacteroides pacaensis]|uniref:DUF4286 family protein n=1 Tax=Parabacteroides pacaensis TaxID=2086575 RepID=UPI000D1033D4|nr:DUF4286 family protein [Parabacteroides pacaensis]
MIIYNTTFHIEKEVLAECVDFLKKTYIPQAIASGFLMNPKMYRVVSSEDEGGESFSIQFSVKNTETLDYWMGKEGKACHRSLLERFGEKIIGFSTLLEEVDWKR